MITLMQPCPFSMFKGQTTTDQCLFGSYRKPECNHTKSGWLGKSVFDFSTWCRNLPPRIIVVVWDVGNDQAQSGQTLQLSRSMISRWILYHKMAPGMDQLAIEKWPNQVTAWCEAHTILCLSYLLVRGRSGQAASCFLSLTSQSNEPKQQSTQNGQKWSRYRSSK